MRAGRRLAGLFVFALGLGACGGGQTMASREPQNDVATVRPEAVQTPGVALGSEAESAALPASAVAPSIRRPLRGTTRSGAGRLTRVRVRPGDTLWKIAERRDVYGSGWLYPLIYKANRKRLPHPTHLPVGLSLVVPRNVSDPDVEKAEEEAMTGQILDRSPLPLARHAAPSATPSPEPTAQPSPEPVLPVPTRRPNFGWGAWSLLGLLLLVGAIFAFTRLRGGDPENRP